MKNNGFRRGMSILLAMLLALALPVQALADEWYLENGDVTVHNDGTTQTVTQNETSKVDAAPVITQQDPSVATSNTITLSSFGDGVASVTISNVNIEAAGESGIDVTDGSSAQIIVSGSNDVTSHYEWGAGGEPAGIHIASGSLTITDDGDAATADVLNVQTGNWTYGAAIGSDGYEDFTAELTITGDVTVNADAATDGCYAAGIGSGTEGDFSGTFNIVNSTVTATGGYSGAGIGSTDYSDMSGSVNIENSTVTATGGVYAAGIGGGDCSDMSGSVNIENSTVTATGGIYASGIGGGDYGEMSGTVAIENSTVTATGGVYASGIGSGSDADFTGNVDISSSQVTVSTDNGEGTTIGTGNGGSFDGQISITNGSEIHAVESGYYQLIGSSQDVGDGKVNIDSTVEIYDDYEGSASAPIPMEELARYIGGSLTVTYVSAGAADTTTTMTADTFWWDVYQTILAAQAGDALTVDAAYRTWIPVSIVKAVQKQEITLTIQWDGGEDIVLTKDSQVDTDGRFLELADLAEQLSGK